MFMRLLTGLRVQHPLEGYPRFAFRILLLILILLSISLNSQLHRAHTLRHAWT